MIEICCKYNQRKAGPWGKFSKEFPAERHKKVTGTPEPHGGGRWHPLPSVFITQSDNIPYGVCYLRAIFIVLVPSAV